VGSDEVGALGADGKEYWKNRDMERRPTNKLHEDGAVMNGEMKAGKRPLSSDDRKVTTSSGHPGATGPGGRKTQGRAKPEGKTHPSPPLLFTPLKIKGWTENDQAES
jgi:hypothetical protein